MPIFLFSSIVLHLVFGSLILVFTRLPPAQVPVTNLPLSATLWTATPFLPSPIPMGEGWGEGIEKERLAKNMQEKALRRAETPAKQTLEDVLYLDSWKRKIEAIGNLNYPAEAQRLGLSGSLKLRVVIYSDGSLGAVELLFSSGESILDQAALGIVRLAAPFAPFPPRMRRNKQVLEIIRTWQFLDSRNLVSL